MIVFMYYIVSNFHNFTPFLAPWGGFADGVAIRANRIPQFFNDSSKGAKAMETAKTQQEPIMNTEPQKEHQWLQKLVGEWTYETEAMMSPDQPPERATGTESVRSIGGLWVVGEGQGEMPCGGAATWSSIDASSIFKRMFEKLKISIVRYSERHQVKGRILIFRCSGLATLLLIQNILFKRPHRE
jgi:hypothetical protein